MTAPFAGDETVRGGPVEHLAGTRARTVLRVRRNVLGVLPILRNTRARSVRSLTLQIRSMQAALHPGSSARKKWFDLARYEGSAACANGTALGARRIATSVSMGPSAQPSHWRRSGVAYPADQELHHDHVLRHGPQG